MNKWVEEELSNIALGDERLNVRCKKILGGFADKPSSSINGSFRGWQESKAAYRFFDNEKVSRSKILLPHIEQAQNRIQRSGSEVVLCVQDTTILDYSHRVEAVVGLGKLHNDSQQGMLLHPTMAFSDEGVCFGMINYKSFIRPKLKGKEARQVVKAVEEKESMRWIESYRITNEIASKYPDKLFINIADREGDFYELLQEYDSVESSAHIIVRAKSNRVLDCNNQESEKKLWDRLRGADVIGQIKFEMSEINSKRQSRAVLQTIRACSISFSPPRKVRKLNKLRPISITAVLCSEENPPAGEKPIEWLLLTSLKIEADRSKALAIVKYYQLRWQIELYFKTLKSGCTIEKLQLENINRLENCLAIYMIIAWRILLLTYISRSCPDASCELFYEQVEWQTVYVIAYKKPPPNIPPTIDAINRIIAGFGGFLNRKNDNAPGIKSMWIGLQRLKDFTLAIEALRTLKTYG